MLVWMVDGASYQCLIIRKYTSAHQYIMEALKSFASACLIVTMPIRQIVHRCCRTTHAWTLLALLMDSQLTRYFCVRNLCLPVPHGSRNRDACTSSARDTTLHSILEWLKEDVRELSSSVSKFAFSNPVDFDGIGRHGARKSLSRVSGLILYKSRHSCFNLRHPTTIFHRDVHQHVSMCRCPRRIAMFEFICDIAVCRRRRLAPATAGD